MTVVVKITPNDRGTPSSKLADAELHFTGGELDGLKLIGFSVWERGVAAARASRFQAGSTASVTNVGASRYYDRLRTSPLRSAYAIWCCRRTTSGVNRREQECKKQLPREKLRSDPMTPEHHAAFERHYRIGELAEMWNVGRLLVKDEQGVIKIRLGRKKAHTIYSVPASVAMRIHTRLLNSR
jgi:hypothetical protein